MSNLQVEEFAPVFTSLDGLPEELYNPAEDGDDSLLAENDWHKTGLPGGHPEIQFQLSALMSTSIPLLDAKIVPFRRELRRNKSGFDVVATKRGYGHQHLIEWKKDFTKLAGDGWVTGTRKFQRKQHLTVDGVYGPLTHARLARFMTPYDIHLYLRQPAHKQTAASARLVSAALFGYHHRSQIYYTQSAARMYGVRHHIRPPGIPTWEDCSSFVTWCYYVAGLPDPNGFQYRGWGFTGTLAQHGWRVSFSRLQPGDLVFYGAPPHHHVSIYIGGGWVISHGSTIGPLRVRWNYRSDAYYARRYLK